MGIFDVIFLFSFLSSLVLMPFFTWGDVWTMKFIYIALCSFLTPIFGTFIYVYIIR